MSQGLGPVVLGLLLLGGAPGAQPGITDPEETKPKAAEPEDLDWQAWRLNQQAIGLWRQGRAREALGLLEKALELRRKLYPESKYPRGHADLAESLNNMGVVLTTLGQPAKGLPYFEQALQMRQRLRPKQDSPAVASNLSNVGSALQALGQPDKAFPYFEQALQMQRRLHPGTDHAALALSLNNMAGVLDALGQPGEALVYCEQALQMRQRLWGQRDHAEIVNSLTSKGHLLRVLGEPGKALACAEQALQMSQRLYANKDHPMLAGALNSMGLVLETLGEPGKALPYFEQGLQISQRLYAPGDHPHVATALVNLAGALVTVGRPRKALTYYAQALEMRRRLYAGKDHPELAQSLNNVGYVLNTLDRPGQALPYFEQAWQMHQRLHRGKDHAEVTVSLFNIGFVLRRLGEPGKALEHCEKSVQMDQRLHPGKDHPHLARALWNLADVLASLGEAEKALASYERAMAVSGAYLDRELALAPEAQALALVRSLHHTRNGLLSVSQAAADGGPRAYGPVWVSKGALLRLLLARRAATLAAHASSEPVRAKARRLTDVRRRVSVLMSSRAGRDKELATLEEERQALERDLVRLLPALQRTKALAGSTPANLAAALPADDVLLDVVRYAHYDRGKLTGWRYLAFVLPPGQPVRRVELGDARPIDEAVASWRRSIDTRESSTAPARLRELVWERIAAALPAGTRTLFVCPEGDLARLPWPALPGKEAGTVLLEEGYLFALVPSGAWLLEQLCRPAAAAGADLLAVGAVDYGPKGKAGYDSLPATERELGRVLESFGLSPTAGLAGKEATRARLLERLPAADFAHLATHGYFDEEALTAEQKRFRAQFQKWDLGRSAEGLEVAPRDPLGFVGLVLAGANEAGTAGLVTGLDVVDLPLERLRLCVLSACQTGLGEVTEAEGVLGLQRAFHVAGCPNVVGSLWAVNDSATAALMAQFYHEVRVNRRNVLEALREAQLTIYRHPERIPALAGERGRPLAEKAVKLGAAPRPRPAGKQEAARRADTRLWAAFVLSGTGRIYAEAKDGR
jgi:CHAT domain-containing protein/Tfp pilus assembly protein PilF